MSPVYLVGVDGSNCSSRALEYVKERARATQGKILVVHIIEWSRFSFSTPQENEERHRRREEEIVRAETEVLQPIIDQLTEEGFEAEGKVRHGHAAEALDQVARENDVTTIVVGRKGSSRLAAQLFGGVASSIVQIADRPVTVVP